MDAACLRLLSCRDRAGAIAAVGAVTDGGEILLNYVSPAARFHGASSALLAALEDPPPAAALYNARSSAP
jgi:hypothetical protein